MDRRRFAPRFLIGTALAAASAAFGAAPPSTPLLAARWLSGDRQLQALAKEPTECLVPATNAHDARLLAIGRSAFRTPLLLGGQGARAGLSCNSCHRNGRGNPDFLFPGLSGAPGTADVTSSLMSSKRGDGHANPIAIPDLSGPRQLLKVSRDPASTALETFVRGLIVEEFDGPEPAALTLAGLTQYLRSLSPNACPRAAEQSIRLVNYLSSARDSAQAAQFALDVGDRNVARLMLASARTALGQIDERYAAPVLSHDRERLRAADRELAAIQNGVDNGSTDSALKIATWLARFPRWAKPLETDEPASLFNPALLAQATVTDR